MKNSSKKPFRIGYFVDTFPRRSENFIVREIAGVSEFWPEMRVHCFRLKPEDWEFVDCRAEAETVPHASISASFLQSMATHLRTMLRKPFRHLSTLLQSFRIHRRSGLRALRRFDQAVQLARLVGEDRITHLHAHFATEPATVCHLTARLLAITYSISAHAEDIWARRPLSAVIEGATCCIACTEEGRAHLAQEFPKAQVQLIHHGLPQLPRTQDNKDSNLSRRDVPPWTIMAAGRFVPKKGYDTLIEACSVLSREGIDYHCEIYGDGAMKDSLVRQIAESGVTDKVHIRSFIPHDELRDRMRSAHLFVIPSRVDKETRNQDGIPNVLLESINEGAIVVGSGLSTLREVIRDGRSGFLYSRATPESLASGIRKALEASDEWPQIRSTAREVLESDFGFVENLIRFRESVELSRRQNRTVGPHIYE